MVDLLDEAGRESVEFVVFPELSLSPYFAAEIRQDAASFAESTPRSPRSTLSPGR